MWLDTTNVGRKQYSLAFNKGDILYGEKGIPRLFMESFCTIDVYRLLYVSLCEWQFCHGIICIHFYTFAVHLNANGLILEWVSREYFFNLFLSVALRYYFVITPHNSYLSGMPKVRGAGYNQQPAGFNPQFWHIPLPKLRDNFFYLFRFLILND